MPAGKTGSLPYRGRLAPSPTGYLHLGHARTFGVAQQRAEEHGGTLILRNEDLDPQRSQPRFLTAFLEDLRWAGFHWREGPDCGGPYAPYHQSQRIDQYRSALGRLRIGGWIYPCTCSRKDIRSAVTAPHAADDEPIYPGTCRPGTSATPQSSNEKRVEAGQPTAGPARVNWRFRVPDGEPIEFVDGFFGPQSFVAGQDFGDFIVWRHDDVPAYQLAVVVDDAAMHITEVVRGADLLVSTARQLLLYRALDLAPPAFFHCPLLTDASGARLAKRHDALSLRHLRESGVQPEALWAGWRDLAAGSCAAPGSG